MGDPGAKYHSLWKLDGQPCLDPVQLQAECEGADAQLPTPFLGKANSLVECAGPYPSHAWILLTGDQLTKLHSKPSERAQPIHTLTISDGERTYTRPNLAVTSLRAVIPTAYSTVQSDQTDLKPEVPYLVELADGRYYGQYSETHGFYGLHYSYNEWLPNNQRHPHRGQGNYFKSFLDDYVYFWKKSLPHISIDAFKTTFPPSAPDDIYNFGENPWTQFTNLLKIVHHRIIPTESGDLEVVSPDQLFTDEILEQFKEAARDYLLHTENHAEPRFFPEDIQVYFRVRDWQWEKAVDPEYDPAWPHVTPADKWRHESPRRFLRQTTDYLPEKWHDYILPGSTKNLWLHLIPVSLERGEESLEPYRADINSIIRNYLTSLTSHAGKSHVVLSGYQTKAFATCRYWDAIAYYDTGNGPMTSLYNHRRDFDPLSIKSFSGRFTQFHDHAIHSPTEDLTAPPDIQREHHPYYRWAYAHIPSFLQNNQTVTELAPGHYTSGTALYSNLPQGLLAWEESRVVIPKIYNPFDTALPLDRDYRIEYNYQPPPPHLSQETVPEQGVWQISQSVSEGGEATDIASLCYMPQWDSYGWGNAPSDFGTPYTPASGPITVQRPNRIIANRHSSLRISQHNQDAVLDIASGPPNTVLTSAPGQSVPRWAWEPKIWGSVQIGGWYRFAQADDGYYWGQGDGIGPPSSGRCAIRLPNSIQAGGGTIVDDPYNPDQSNVQVGSLLAVRATDGNHAVDTRWTYPGVNASGIYVKLYEEGAGDDNASWYRFQISSGIITAISKVSRMESAGQWYYYSNIPEGAMPDARKPDPLIEDIDNDEPMREDFSWCVNEPLEIQSHFKPRPQQTDQWDDQWDAYGGDGDDTWQYTEP